MNDTPSNDAPVQPGDILAGKYEVQRVLGAGGMGVVVAALHLQLRQQVAIKFLLPHCMHDQSLVTRFLREAQAATAITSEHVTRVLDVGTLDSGAPYMVMEYLGGRDLEQLVSGAGPLPVSTAVDFVLQAMEALAEAHAAGIVHRDLKPANLFLTQRADGSTLVKVLDFGISKATTTQEAGANLTGTQSVLGSPMYMSPEQIRSSKHVDARADIWALGVILYELLTGRTPFGGDSAGAVLASILTDNPAPVTHFRPDAPPGLEALVARCLQKVRDHRFGDVAELAQALAPFASSDGNVSTSRITGVLNRVRSTSATVAAQTPLVVPTGAGVNSPPGAQGASAGPTDGPWSRTKHSQAGPNAGPRAKKSGLALTVVALSGAALLIAIIGGALLIFKPGAPNVTTSSPLASSAASAVPVYSAPPTEDSYAAKPPIPEQPATEDAAAGVESPGAPTAKPTTKPRKGTGRAPGATKKPGNSDFDDLIQDRR